MPSIFGFLSIQIGRMVVTLILCEDAIAGILLYFPAVLQRSELLHLRSAASRHQSSLRVRSLLRDDVDDPVYRVRAPHRSARSANHLDPVDVLQRHVLRVPINAAEQ